MCWWQSFIKTVGQFSVPATVFYCPAFSIASIRILLGFCCPLHVSPVIIPPFNFEKWIFDNVLYNERNFKQLMDIIDQFEATKYDEHDHQIFKKKVDEYIEKCFPELKFKSKYRGC